LDGRGKFGNLKNVESWIFVKTPGRGKKGGGDGKDAEKKKGSHRRNPPRG